MISATEEAAVREWVKVPNISGLYRHTVSGRYYGVKKIHGRRKERSLGTTDRKIAERRHREWVGNLQRVDRERERTTLRELLERFVAVNRGRSIKTQKCNRSIIRNLMKTWPGGINIEVGQIRPSHLDEWLALHEPRLKNTTYNRYAGLLKQLFEIAVKDRIVAESPFDQVTTRWKKPQAPIRRVPTLEQFETIVQSIRGQAFNGSANESADFLEFLGLAGLGQAEAGSLTRADVDLVAGQIITYRHKTSTGFAIPIFPQVRPLLERLCEGKMHNACVFKISDARKALTGACRRLGYPPFSQRSLRRMFITRAIERGVDVKVVAQWQGHKDGGKLILETYSHVRPEHSNRMAQLMSDGEPANVVPMAKAEAS